MDSPTAADTARLEDLLVKTSRTFALSIPVLPEPTRREVMVAYLLFRVADTLEDATLWPPARRIEELSRFGALLEPSSTEAAQELARSWAKDPPLDHAGYNELLAALPELLAAWRGLEDEARTLVGRHTLRTVEAMQGFVRRAEGCQNLQLRDIPDLRDYCYAVAGIVGEMLTELFLVGRESLAPAAPFLRERAARFGEALQLVNILRDASGDVTEGRSYLPSGVSRSEVFALAHADLDTATAFIARLQEARAPRGIVAFCALPVRLARATLAKVEREGPGAKVSRAEIAELVAGLEAALDAGRPAA